MSRKNESLAWLCPWPWWRGGSGSSCGGWDEQAERSAPCGQADPAAPLPTIAWFGGSSRDNIDALAFLFASRTSTARCCSGRCKPSRQHVRQSSWDARMRR